LGYVLSATPSKTSATPLTPSVSATSSGDGNITYAVQSAGTTSCTVNSATGVLSFTAVGTCVVRATAASTARYNEGFTDTTFVVSVPAVVTSTPATPAYRVELRTPEGVQILNVSGAELKLPKNAFKRKGYLFAGWNVLVNGTGKTYFENDLLKLTSDTILYSQWRLAPTTKKIIGFAPNASALNRKVTSKINNFIATLPITGSVRCIGSTSGIGVSESATLLAKARAERLCRLIKIARPEFKTSIALNVASGIGPKARSVVLDFK
jgi:hypothetical protein